MHVEDVVGADRRRHGPLGRRVRAPGDHESEGRAEARGAVDLEEGEVVAPREKLHPSGRDALLADRAAMPVRERQEVVQRIHPSGVYPVGRSAALEPARLSAIPPGGMIASMTTPDTQPADAADHFRHSYTRDKSQLVRRLARIEGQVRGITRMIEREEYCVDILQQTSALRAAVDSLAVLVLEDHVTGCVRTAAANGEADRYIEEVVDVVRRTLGRPVRSATRS
jgi:DNA-binding FrmR family transcriptional regulator